MERSCQACDEPIVGRPPAGYRWRPGSAERLNELAAANGPAVRIGLVKTSDPKILRAMTKRQKATAGPLFLGIECGGTRSTFMIAEEEPTFHRQGKVGPAHLRLMSD